MYYNRTVGLVNVMLNILHEKVKNLRLIQVFLTGIQ